MPPLPSRPRGRARPAALAVAVVLAVCAPVIAARAGANPLPQPLPVPIPSITRADVGPPASAQGPHGYWLVASDGGIFAFGGVPFEGSTGAIRLNRPIVGMASTPTGRGYWLVASDGGIFAFGDASFFGSLAGLPSGARPSSPVTAIVATPDGGGYWVATAAGGIYAFGDARFSGSLGGVLPASVHVVAMASTPDGGGYWLATGTGAVYSFGDAPFAGSAALVPLAHPIVGLAPTPDGAGYWLVASDGGIFSFGDAAFRGSTGAIRLNQPIVGMGVGRAADPYAPGVQGYDISFPQCGQAMPPSAAFGIVGVNDGRAFTQNPCFGAEAAWAGPSLSVYMNLNAPPSGSSQGLNGPAGPCAAGDTGCMAYNYGYNAAVDAHAYATASGATASVWWLDVETANSWDSNTTNNSRTVQGALDALGALGTVAGIYSTPYQWGVITGGYTTKTPIWVATGSDLATAEAFCAPSHAFGGGAIWLTQYGTTGVPYDQDIACPAPS